MQNMKRVFDFIISVVALVVLSPMLIVAAALNLARTRFDRNGLARQLEAILQSVVDGK